MQNPLKYLNKDLNGLTPEYRRLVLRIYLVVIKLMLTTAIPHLIKGIFYLILGRKEKQYKEFIKGSILWGKEVTKITKSNLIYVNDIKIPESGHMIFLNHVNEIDFAFDCIVVGKPFLANQSIKSSVFAYWWMTAMGSKVFDTSHQRTISTSVRELMKALKKQSYIVYPEGGNSYSEEMRPLKKGMIKLAFDEKVPVYILVKSGLINLQTNQLNNTIGYKFCGILNPSDFSSWEDFKEAIHNTMIEEKKTLDSEILIERIPQRS